MKTKLRAVLLILLPIAAGALCLCAGRYSLAVTDIFGAAADDTARRILLNVRLPRVLMAFVAGAGLSAAGAAMQSLFSNPLAAPDTVGTAGGACFGAAAGVLSGGGILLTEISAFGAGLAASALTVLASGRRRERISMILSGLAVAGLADSLTALVKYIADPLDELPAVTYWLLGSMAGASYRTLLFAAVPVAVGVSVIYAMRWQLDILTLSTDEAMSLGLDVRRCRIAVIAASSLITAAVVSVCGKVGWVGLLIPHMARLMGCTSGRKLIPACISLGGTFMIAVDTLARTLTPAEIPVSVLTGIICAPAFILLIKKANS